MESITAIVMYLGVIAAMSERIMEMLKSLTDMVNKIEDERWRMMVIQLVTFIASAISAAIYPPSEVAMLNKIPYGLSIIVVGLLGSTGSSIWHDLLGTLTAVKEQKKAAVEQAKQPQ